MGGGDDDAGRDATPRGGGEGAFPPEGAQGCDNDDAAADSPSATPSPLVTPPPATCPSDDASLPSPLAAGSEPSTHVSKPGDETGFESLKRLSSAKLEAGRGALGEEMGVPGADRGAFVHLRRDTQRVTHVI